MRRTAVAVTGFGVVMGVFAAGGLSPASASPANTHAAGRGLASSHVSRAGSSAIRTKSKPSGPTAPATSGTGASGMQTVTYDGYSVTVPASWQVFHLDSDPGQCVRYDINAVYLGSPGANQNCPSNLMGRAETITITPAGVSGSSSQASGGGQSAAAQGGMVQSPPPSDTGRAISAKASSLSRMSAYSQESELRASVAGSKLSVTATYGTDSSAVTRYVSSLRRSQPIRASSPSGTVTPPRTPAPPKTPVTTKSTASTTRTTTTTKTTTTKTATKAPATTKTPAPTKAPTTTKSTASTTKTTSATKATGTSKPASTTSSTSTLASTLKPSVPSSPLAGFDTCTAPSLNAMKAWKSRYSAIGIYIGGQNIDRK